MCLPKWNPVPPCPQVVRVPETPPLSPFRAGFSYGYVCHAGDCNHSYRRLRTRLRSSRVGLPPISPRGTKTTPAFLIGDDKLRSFATYIGSMRLTARPLEELLSDSAR
jgi:hypothetical protein